MDNILNVLLFCLKISPLILFICLIVNANKSKKNGDEYEERDFEFRSPTAIEIDASERLLVQLKRSLKIVDIVAVPVILFFVLEARYVIIQNHSDAAIIGGADAPTYGFLLSQSFAFIILAVAVILCFVAANLSIIGRINDIKEGRFLVVRCTVIDRIMRQGPKSSKYYCLTLQDSCGTTDELRTNFEVYREADIGSECLIVRYSSEDKVNKGRRGNKVKHREVIPI